MWSYETQSGTFYIVPNDDGHYVVLLEKEMLGTYDSPEQAAEAVSDGAVFEPRSRGVDFEKLKIPDDLYEWKYCVT